MVKVASLEFIRYYFDDLWNRRGTLLVAQLVEALRYKSENLGFDSRWCRWNLFAIILMIYGTEGARCWWHSWLRHCGTSRKISVSIPDGVVAIYSLLF